MPNCKFMEDVNKRRRISFPSLNLSADLKKSTPGKFAYICHLEQIEINATKTEKRGIHFKIDVSATVLVESCKFRDYKCVSRNGEK